MYRVIKRMEISGAHKLSLPYESKCRGLHGHNWIITVYCQSETLDENGMVVDFSRIKELVHGRLDHQFLNDVMDQNPTAENMARWICEQVPHCYKVQIQESEGNIVEYEIDA
ncbi:6-carboxytetrahydropterin synthase QueD [Fibrobacter succinogenes]|uniref:6-carboxytetrahydropterin synthase QueD n=1 Tax=Fibrobacter succinogenes TaxID=833 RepID=UPI0015651B8F|nr:6-carboxytetrahydropterin synthase QueD [Fibrobacter succinogenes]